MLKFIKELFSRRKKQFPQPTKKYRVVPTQVELRVPYRDITLLMKDGSIRQFDVEGQLYPDTRLQHESNLCNTRHKFSDPPKYYITDSIHLTYTDCEGQEISLRMADVKEIHVSPIQYDNDPPHIVTDETVEAYYD